MAQQSFLRMCRNKYSVIGRIHKVPIINRQTPNKKQVYSSPWCNYGTCRENFKKSSPSLIHIRKCYCGNQQSGVKTAKKGEVGIFACGYRRQKVYLNPNYFFHPVGHIFIELWIENSYRGRFFFLFFAFQSGNKPLFPVLAIIAIMLVASSLLQYNFVIILFITHGQLVCSIQAHIKLNLKYIKSLTTIL